MNLQPMSQQPISDDQELAKVLAGVGAQDDNAANEPQIETTMVPTPSMLTPSDTPQADATAAPDTTQDTPAPEAPAPDMPDFSMPAAPSEGSGNENLESIKQDALNELRPLVDKLDVAPEEKFDTYLLLLRSTDDGSLIAPAHEAAKNIPDEARRAQALLDIIKEIDFLSQPAQQ